MPHTRQDVELSRVYSTRVMLTKEEDDRLDELVHITRRSKSDLVREGLEIIYDREIANKK